MINLVLAGYLTWTSSFIRLVCLKKKSVCLPIHPSIHPLIYLLVCIFDFLNICPPFCLSICLSIYLSLCLSVSPSIHLSVYVLMYLIPLCSEPMAKRILLIFPLILFPCSLYLMFIILINRVVKHYITRCARAPKEHSGRNSER